MKSDYCLPKEQLELSVRYGTMPHRIRPDNPPPLTHAQKWQWGSANTPVTMPVSTPNMLQCNTGNTQNNDRSYNLTNQLNISSMHTNLEKETGSRESIPIQISSVQKVVYRNVSALNRFDQPCPHQTVQVNIHPKNKSSVIYVSNSLNCFLCEEVIKEYNFNKHLFFGYLECINCGESWNDCQQFQKLLESIYRKQTSCKHLYRFTNDPFHYLRVRIAEDIKKRSDSHSFSVKELMMKIASYIKKLKTLESKEPWKGAILHCKRGIENTLHDLNTHGMTREDKLLNTKEKHTSSSFTKNDNGNKIHIIPPFRRPDSLCEEKHKKSIEKRLGTAENTAEDDDNGDLLLSQFYSLEQLEEAVEYEVAEDSDITGTSHEMETDKVPNGRMKSDPVYDKIDYDINAQPAHNKVGAKSTWDINRESVKEALDKSTQDMMITEPLGNAMHAKQIQNAVIRESIQDMVNPSQTEEMGPNPSSSVMNSGTIPIASITELANTKDKAEAIIDKKSGTVNGEISDFTRDKISKRNANSKATKSVDMASETKTSKSVYGKITTSCCNRDNRKVERSVNNSSLKNNVKIDEVSTDTNSSSLTSIEVHNNITHLKDNIKSGKHAKKATGLSCDEKSAEVQKLKRKSRKRKFTPVRHAALKLPPVDRDGDVEFVKTPDNGYYYVVCHPIEECPMCYTLLCPSSFTVNVVTFLITAICSGCNLTIYIVTETPNNSDSKISIVTNKRDVLATASDSGIKKRRPGRPCKSQKKVLPEKS